MASLEGALVRKWRLAQGLTQEHVGEACRPPVGKGSIADWEKGRNSMSVANLLRLVKALEVPGRDDAQRLARFFMGPEGAPFDDAIDAQRAAAREARRAERALRQLAGSGPRR